MSLSSLRKPFLLAAAFLLVWLGLKYLLPVLLPFLLGGLLALAAEPVVGFGTRQLRLPRGLAAGLGVTATLVLLLTVLSVAGAAAVKELGSLARAVPDLEATARQGIVVVQDWLISVADKTPEGVRPILTRTVLNLFDDSNQVLEQVSSRLPGMVTAVLGWVPDGFLGIGTGILAGFMFSARLPKLKQALAARLPERWYTTCLPALKRVHRGLGLWLKAQGKLAAVIYGIVAVGFLLLRIPYGPLWAVLVALVDAVPLLGTGTVLLPWALVLLLQGNPLRAVGLLAIYAAALLTRTVLEPRLVGKQLGLDPLVTLLVMYLGYRFWGFLGLLLAPVLATAARSITETEENG